MTDKKESKNYNDKEIKAKLQEFMTFVDDCRTIEGLNEFENLYNEKKKEFLK